MRKSFNFSIILRIAAILLGIASATLMATTAFSFTFNDDIVEILNGVENFIGIIVWPFELLLVRPSIKWLHECGLVFDLHEHWRNVFVLLWLFNGTLSRSLFPASRLMDQDRPESGWRLYGVLHWVWSSLVALLGGILAGTVSLEHPAVLWWPVAALFLFLAGSSFILAPIVGGPRGAVMALTAVLVSLLAVGIIPTPSWLPFQGVPGRWLACLATFVSIFGAFYLFASLYIALRTVRGDHSLLNWWLGSPPAQTGLDVLAVLGGATAVVYVAHQLA